MRGEKRWFYIIQQRQGKSLHDLVYSGRCDVSQALNMGIQLIDQIKHIHKAGLTHNDIKPDNIVVGDPHQADPRQGKLKIIDFGTASKYVVDGKHVDENNLVSHIQGNYLLNSSHIL